jgi:hypothetical protein
LQIDAQVNIAWTHYFNNEFDRADESLKQAEIYFPDDCWIREGRELPIADREDPYLYQQLSKVFGLRGKMGMDGFRNRTKQIGDEHSQLEVSERHAIVHKDKVARDHLRQAAESYVLALGYAQLLSPRSSALNRAYDTLYNYIKTFNTTEMMDFQSYEHAARLRYKMNEIKLIDLGNLDEFLRDSFGVYIEEA